eukprot:Skav210554  [mRNA]  locus=scaffold2699:30947:31819:- [translate_table: standard]
MMRRGGAELATLLESEQPDITFLQEHKLQEIHVPQLEPELLEMFNRVCGGEHCASWAVSTSRKGYSGVCAIYRTSAGGGVQNIVKGEIDQVDADEGRSVRLDLACGLIVVGMYVPNSGQKLARLDYRVDVWDEKLQAHLRELDAKAGQGGGLVICGDLNVAHQDIDIWNSESPRIRQQAGTTPRERESFSKLLSDLDLIDAFRHGHPEAREVYSYWSTRTRSREVNKGLRLDYFLCSARLFKQEATTGVTTSVVSSSVLDTFNGSDHCPISCVLSVPNTEKTGIQYDSTP